MRVRVLCVYVYEQEMEMETVNELKQWKNDEIMEFSPFISCVHACVLCYSQFVFVVVFLQFKVFHSPPENACTRFILALTSMMMSFKWHLSLVWKSKYHCCGHTTVSHTSIQLTLPCSSIKPNQMVWVKNIYIHLCSIPSLYSSKIHKGIQYKYIYVYKYVCINLCIGIENVFVHPNYFVWKRDKSLSNF